MATRNVPLDRPAGRAEATVTSDAAARRTPAKTYRLGAGQRAANRVYRWLTERGLGARYRQIVTVPGRRTGRPRSTPVDVLDVGPDRWLVAPYGEVNWVRNVRAAGEVTLRRGRRVERLRAEEVPPGEAVPVIRAYIRTVRVTRRYWEVSVDATDADVAAAATRHPVFRLTVPPARS